MRRTIAVIFGLMFLVSALAAVSVAPRASAGNEEDPEVTDAEGDAEIYIWPAIEIPAPGISDLVDVLRIWVCNETDEMIRIVMQVKNLSSEVQTTSSDIRYYTSFVIDKYIYTVGAFGELSVEGMYYGLYYYPYPREPDDEGSDWFDIMGKADLDNNTVTFFIPKNLLHYPMCGSSLNIDYADSVIVFSSPVGIVGGEIVDWVEKGKEYVFKYDTKSPLSISLKPENVSAAAGKNAIFEVNIVNEGDEVVNNVRLKVDGISGWNCTFVPDEVSILAHTTNTSILTIRVPENVSDANIKITVTASCKTGNANSEATLLVTGKKVVPDNNGKEEYPPLTPKGEDSPLIPGFESVGLIGAVAVFVIMNRKNR